jgi:hypothetical protein
MRVKGLNRSKAIWVFAAFWLMVGYTPLWAGSNPKWIEFGAKGEKAPQINVTESNFDRVEFEVKIFGMRSEELQTKGGVFNQLSVPDCGITNVIGEPKLPVVRKMVQIPYGAEVEVEGIAFDVSEKSLEELGITNRIIPVQPPIPKIEGALEKAEFVIHEDFYQTDQFFPTQVAEKGEIAVIRGHRFVVVEVYPVSYNPVSGKLRIYSDVRVRVNLTGSDRMTTESMLARYASPPFEEICHDLFINYSAYQDMIKGLPTLPIGYLIIVHNDFQSQAAPLAEWKAKKGYHVTVANTTQTGTTTNSIKTYISQAYNDWPIPPTYVLFFGDVGWIPTYTGTNSGTATDLYFVQMDGDMFADILRARFPVRSTTEATDMVNKQLYYENPTSFDLEWMRHMLFIASSDHSSLVEGTHRYAIFNYLVPMGVIVDTLWERLGGVTSQAITNSINAGKSIVCYSGHGSSSGWATGSYDQTDVRNLSNFQEYPLVLSHACSTNPFDMAECFGETWVKVADKGGIAFWGASNSSYWDEDDILERRMFDAAFAETCYTVAAMTDRALFHLAEYYGANDPDVKYYFDMYNVNGDPSVDIWTYIAETLLVDYPTTIAMAPSEVTITVETDGEPLYGALVCLRKGSEVFETGYTNVAGQATLYPSPLTPGYVELTITAHNILPFEDSILVVPGAYIVFEKWHVDDDSLDESLGNNDGDVDFGETIELPILLKNMGDSTCSNVEATLSTDHPQITITDDHEVYGDIAAHDTMWCQDDFGFAVSPEIGDSEIVMFELEITADNGSWTRSDLALLVHAPVLAYESNVIDDFKGDGDGEPDPGETCDMTVVLKNQGSQGAIQISGDLTCNDPYVTITASSSNYPDIAPDDTGSSVVPYQFEAKANCPLGYVATFELEISGAGPYSAVDTFYISIGRKSVLLVDDDAGESYDTFFVSALNSWGILCDVWEHDLSGSPSDSVLNSYKAVVWTTGEDFGSLGNPSTLTLEDQANLQAYLDNGGKLFLSSQDFLYDNNPNEFIVYYLHVLGHTDDQGINSVGGVPGDTISDGMAITLSYPFSNLSDYLVPGAGATGIFYSTGKTSPSSRDGISTLPSFPEGDPDQTDYCALRYPATGTADYQVVFFAFSFEAIPQSGDDPNNAKTVMGNIMNWFGISKLSFTIGDANGDGEIDIADVVYLVNYLFAGGSEPFPMEAGDTDCNGEVDIADVILLINYLFTGGPPPNC